MARKKVSKRRLREAIEAQYGNVMKICEELNISRQTFYNYVNGDEAIEDLWKSARESIVDIASSQLMKHVTVVNDGLGDLKAITFVLETWGKDKGWSKRTEITGADGAALFGGHFDADVVEYLKSKGLTVEDAMSEAASQFNDLIKQMKEQEADA